VLRQRQIPLILFALALAGCVRQPNLYLPEGARKPQYGGDGGRLGFLVEMGDPKAAGQIVGDISPSIEANAWRWAGKRPTVLVGDPGSRAMKVAWEFTLPESGFAMTGPVTIAFFLNDKLLEKAAYDKPGEKKFTRAVPADWLVSGFPVRLSAEIDKAVDLGGGAPVRGFILRRVGLEP
jgi:hypothetical protein